MPSVVVLSIVNVALLIAGLWWWGVRINVTDSVPMGLYRSVAGAPERGDLVEACLPPAAARLATARGYLIAHGACGTHMPVIKRVLGVAGDVIGVNKHVVCNGRTLDTAPVLAADPGGRPLVPAPGGTLGPHELWLISDEIPEAYDSRYFGPVTRSAVRSVMRPLWTV